MSISSERANKIWDVAALEMRNLPSRALVFLKRCKNTFHALSKTRKSCKILSKHHKIYKMSNYEGKLQSRSTHKVSKGVIFVEQLTHSLTHAHTHTHTHRAMSGQTGRQKGSWSELGSDQFTVHWLPTIHRTHTHTKTHKHCFIRPQLQSVCTSTCVWVPMWVWPCF